MYLHDSSRAWLTVADFCYFPSWPLLDTAMFAFIWGEGFLGAGKMRLGVTSLAAVSYSLNPQRLYAALSWFHCSINPGGSVSLLSVTDLLGPHRSGGCCQKCEFQHRFKNREREERKSFKYVLRSFKKNKSQNKISLFIHWLAEHLQDIKQRLSPGRWLGWDGKELSKISRAQY